MTKKLEQHEEELAEMQKEIDENNVEIKIKQKKGKHLNNRKSNKILVIKIKKSKLKLAID